MEKKARVAFAQLAIDWIYWFHFSGRYTPYDAYGPGGPDEYAKTQLRGIERQMHELFAAEGG